MRQRGRWGAVSNGVEGGRRVRIQAEFEGGEGSWQANCAGGFT